jgi:hypothetical protein
MCFQQQRLLSSNSWPMKTYGDESVIDFRENVARMEEKSWDASTT